MFCYFGEQFTHAFSHLNDAIYKCDWYLLPVETQKMIGMIAINTQRPIYFKGFGNVCWTLETFKKVITFQKSRHIRIFD